MNTSILVRIKQIRLNYFLIFLILNFNIPNLYSQGLATLGKKILVPTFKLVETSLTQIFIKKSLQQVISKGSLGVAQRASDNLPNTYKPHTYKVDPFANELVNKSASEKCNTRVPSFIPSNSLLKLRFISPIPPPLFNIMQHYKKVWNNKFNPYVYLIQEKLNEYGAYNLKVDGIFGKQTEKILRDYLNNSKLDLPTITDSINEREAYSIFEDLAYGLFESKSKWKYKLAPNTIPIHGCISANFPITSDDTFNSCNAYYESFFQKIDTLNSETPNFLKPSTFENVLFLLFHEVNSHSFLTTIRNVSNRQFIGDVYDITSLNDSINIHLLDQKIYKNAMDKKIVVFGDILPDYGKRLISMATNNNATIIYRKTETRHCLNRISEVLSQFEHKKLDFRNLSILNGIPQNEKDVLAQDFPLEGLSILQELRDKINTEVQNKGKLVSETPLEFIPNKKSLLDELVNGNKDILILFAHSNEKYIYLGSDRISIEELESLPDREKTRPNRIAILFSCSTANIFNKEKKWYNFFRRVNKSFAETLINKNLFDLVVAPSSTINGDEILKMIQELDQHDILELSNKLQKFVNDSEIYNLANK